MPSEPFDSTDQESFDESNVGPSGFAGDQSGPGDGATAADKIVPQVLSGTSTGFSLVALLLFFLPWLSLSCGGEKVASQSGYQVVVGKLSPDKQFERKMKSLGEEMTKGFGEQTDFPMGSPPSGFDTSPRPEQGVFEAEDVNPFYLLALFPAGLLLATVSGIVLFWQPRPGTAPMLPLAGAGIAAVTIVICFFVEFPMEHEIRKETQAAASQQGPNLAAAVFQVERTGIFITAAVFTFLALGVVVGHMVFVKRRNVGRRGAHFDGL